MRILQRISMKWAKKVNDPPIIFEFHIRILKVICCRSKKKFVVLEITGPYLLNMTYLLCTKSWQKCPAFLEGAKDLLPHKVTQLNTNLDAVM